MGGPIRKMETGTIAIPKTGSAEGDAIFVYIENNSAIFCLRKTANFRRESTFQLALSNVRRVVIWSGARATVAVQYAEQNLHSLGWFLSSERNEVRDMQKWPWLRRFPMIYNA